jgi:chromosome segregation protein
LEKVKKDAIQEIKKALNPSGKTTVEKKDLRDFFKFADCPCRDYQNYEEHIKNHLETIAQVQDFVKKILVIIERVRANKKNKQKSSKGQQKPNQLFDNFLAKNSKEKIKKLEKITAIDSLIQEANSLLASGLCTEKQKKRIQSVKEKLEIRKRELTNKNKEQSQENQLRIELNRLQEESKLLHQQIENLGNEQKKSQELTKKLEEKIKHLNDINQNLQNLINQQTEKISQKEKSVAKKNTTINEKERVIIELKRDGNNLQSEVQKLKQELQELREKSAGQSEKEEAKNLDLAQQFFYQNFFHNYLVDHEKKIQD